MQNKAFGLLGLFVMATSYCSAQDFVRFGGLADFKKGHVVQSFGFDLNRTEKIDEKAGKYLIFNRYGYYFLPVIDVNIGEKTTSSENNITAQLNFGKRHFGKVQVMEKWTRVFNYAIELNPTFSSDKQFNEKMNFGQLKLILNNIAAKENNLHPAYTHFESSLAYGLFTNGGIRNSRTYSRDNLYFTGGGFTEMKWRFAKKVNLTDEETYDNWILKLSGNYYYIFSDIPAIYSHDWAGQLKASVDKKVYKYVYAGLIYKYGNDNPTYTTINTLELTFKLNY